MKICQVKGFITREEIARWVEVTLSHIKQSTPEYGESNSLVSKIEFKVPFDQTMDSDGFTGVEFTATLESKKQNQQRKDR